MTHPVRLQLSRKRGFDLQAWSRGVNGLAAVNVARPGPFGNPFTVAEETKAFGCRKAIAHLLAVSSFRRWLSATDESFESSHVYDGMKQQRDTLLLRLPELRGRNLACFCSHDFCCHADVLLKLANAEAA